MAHFSILAEVRFARQKQPLNWKTYRAAPSPIRVFRGLKTSEKEHLLGIDFLRPGHGRLTDDSKSIGMLEMDFPLYFHGVLHIQFFEQFADPEGID